MRPGMREDGFSTVIVSRGPSRVRNGFADVISPAFPPAGRPPCGLVRAVSGLAEERWLTFRELGTLLGAHRTPRASARSAS